MNSRINHIKIGRVYNLGNYEHVRYELSVEVQEGESAESAFRGLEQIIKGLEPAKGIKEQDELDRDQKRIDAMRKLSAEEWAERHWGVGTREEVIQRYEDSLAADRKRREESITRAAAVRALFDDLGGAAEWKDAKQDWDEP